MSTKNMRCVQTKTVETVVEAQEGVLNIRDVRIPRILSGICASLGYDITIEGSSPSEHCQPLQLEFRRVGTPTNEKPDFRITISKEGISVYRAVYTEGVQSHTEYFGEDKNRRPIWKSYEDSSNPHKDPFFIEFGEARHNS